MPNKSSSIVCFGRKQQMQDDPRHRDAMIEERPERVERGGDFFEALYRSTAIFADGDTSVS